MTSGSIVVNELTYAYAGTAKPALAHLSFTVPAGQICAVVGSNGSGKSTLCLTLAGFVPSHMGGRLTGQVSVAGHAVASSSPADLVGEVGLVFQDPRRQITGARSTVREEIAFGLENMGVARAEMAERVAATLALVGLGELADRSPEGLSLGQEQRLALASILVVAPRVLILDEPTAHLDPAGRRQLRAVLQQLVAETGITLMVVDQQLEWLAGLAERALVLADGRLVADGPTREVLADPTVIARGLRPTGYTLAGQAVRAAGLTATAGPLPCTLAQAVEFLR